jgi:hypothetical protein
VVGVGVGVCMCVCARARVCTGLLPRAVAQSIRPVRNTRYLLSAVTVLPCPSQDLRRTFPAVTVLPCPSQDLRRTFPAVTVLPCPSQDLRRTFPASPDFDPDCVAGLQNLQRLERVLSAFALRCFPQCSTPLVPL